jgi:hypothetical protein
MAAVERAAERAEMIERVSEDAAVEREAVRAAERVEMAEERVVERSRRRWVRRAADLDRESEARRLSSEWVRVGAGSGSI